MGANSIDINSALVMTVLVIKAYGTAPIADQDGFAVLTIGDIGDIPVGRVFEGNSHGGGYFRQGPAHSRS